VYGYLTYETVLKMTHKHISCYLCGSNRPWARKPP